METFKTSGIEKMKAAVVAVVVAVVVVTGLLKTYGCQLLNNYCYIIYARIIY